MTSNIETWARPDHSDLLGENLWDEILPGLWQGGTDDYDTVQDMRRRNENAFITPKDFDTVITLYGWAQPVDWFVKEIRFGFWDAGTETMPVDRVFEVALAAYDEWKSGRKTLIRCQAGLNRSGLITALVLMMDGYTADEAITLIREKRNNWALCNADFVEWLKALDQAEIQDMVA